MAGQSPMTYPIFGPLAIKTNSHDIVSILKKETNMSRPKSNKPKRNIWKDPSLYGTYTGELQNKSWRL
jgi:hypothetical protein